MKTILPILVLILFIQIGLGWHYLPTYDFNTDLNRMKIEPNKGQAEPEIEDEIPNEKIKIKIQNKMLDPVEEFFKLRMGLFSRLKQLKRNE